MTLICIVANVTTCKLHPFEAIKHPFKDKHIDHLITKMLEKY